MTVEVQGAEAARDFAADWRAVRGDGAIQFDELPPAPPPDPPPEWLEALQRFLGRIFGPIVDALAALGPALKLVLVALAVAAVVYVLWRILRDVEQREGGAAAEDWVPQREAALALLEDADRLAAEGRFDEAAHLLLQRSVGHIREARPHWLDPSTTAREIAGSPSLPQRARTAFGTISERVERSLFALRPLVRDDWLAARSAYEDFALAKLTERGA